MSGIDLAPDEGFLPRVVQAVIQLMAGRNNAAGSCTLTNGVTTTLVSAPNCAKGSRVFLFPETLNAAAIVTGTYVLRANVDNGAFMVTHPNTANVDQDFSWIALG